MVNRVILQILQFNHNCVARNYIRHLYISSLTIVLWLACASISVKAETADSLIEQYAKANYECDWSFTNSEVAKKKPCEKRDVIWDALYSMGYTMGCEGEFGYESVWRNDCKSSSANNDILVGAFTCSGTAEFATNLLNQSAFGLVKFEKMGVGTVEASNNLLICRLVVKSFGAQSIIYTATALDNGSVWIEFPSDSTNTQPPRYSPPQMPPGTFETPSYLHEAQPRMPDRPALF